MVITENRFIHTKITITKSEIMLHETLQNFPQYELPLPCNDCMNIVNVAPTSADLVLELSLVTEQQLTTCACSAMNEKAQVVSC